jgi:hypothetical protein
VATSAAISWAIAGETLPPRRYARPEESTGVILRQRASVRGAAACVLLLTKMDLFAGRSDPGLGVSRSFRNAGFHPFSPHQGPVLDLRLTPISRSLRRLSYATMGRGDSQLRRPRRRGSKI